MLVQIVPHHINMIFRSTFNFVLDVPTVSIIGELIFYRGKKHKYLVFNSGCCYEPVLKMLPVGNTNRY